MWFLCISLALLTTIGQLRLVGRIIERFVLQKLEDNGQHKICSLLDLRLNWNVSFDDLKEDISLEGCSC